MTQSAPETVNRLLQHLQSQLQLLQFHHPYLSEPVKTFFQITRLNLSIDVSGKIDLIFTSQDGAVTRLPLEEERTSAVENRIARIQSLSEEENGGVILHHLYHAEELLQLLVTCAKGIKGLIVVEPDMPRFIRVFMQADLEKVIKTPWQFFCAGNLTKEAIQKNLEEKGLSCFQRWSVIESVAEPRQDNNPSVIKSLLKDLHDKNRAIEEELRSRPFNVVSTSISRILILDSWSNYPGSLHLQAFEKAFDRRGIDARRIPVTPPDGHPFGHSLSRCIKERLLQVIHDFAPDWIFSLQNHTYEYVTPEFYEQVQYPWITFVSTVWLNRPPYGKNEILFLAEDGTRSQIEKDGARHVAFLPLAADYVDPVPINLNEQSVPVSFLGSCNYPTGEAFLQFKEALKPFGNLLNVIREWVEVKTTENAFDSLWAIQNLPMLAVLPSEEMRSKTAKFIECWLGGTRRLKTVTALQRFGIKVFGPDWHLVAPKNFVEQCYGGTFRDYEKERELYRRSKINLNVHWQGNVTGPNMRYFNVPAVGGFQLTNEGPGFRNYFAHDSEIAVYNDIQSLVEKTDYYLTHDEERLEMAQQAHRRVLDEHLYEHRVDEILDVLKCLF